MFELLVMRLYLFSNNGVKITCKITESIINGQKMLLL